MKSCFIVRSLVGIAAALVPGVAMASTIVNGLYTLHDHPDGEQRPPSYGLRLDELFNATSDHDVFTFDFDNALSNMHMTYYGTTIHIYGVAFGGRDTGTAYANDGYRGVYTIDFVYNLGVGHVPGDDDVYVDPGYQYNYGSITTPGTVPGGATTIALRDGHYGNGQPDFRLGDEDNDQGHRGFNGTSGWGWLFTNTGQNHAFVNYESNDWLFTASLAPTPGAAALMGLGALAAGRRRR